MNKKQKEVASEDLEIKRVAHFRNSQQILLLVILVVLFTLTFFCTLVYISKYYEAKFTIKDDTNIMEYKTKDSNVLITNNGIINKTITEEDTDYNNEYLIEKVATIKFITKKDAVKDGTIHINLRYNIYNNDFEHKVISNIKNDVLVRFWYSYDNENWEYVKNVISTTNSTLTPLMGGYYDISGLEDNLKVLTNFEINNKIDTTKTIYFKCETFLKNIKNNIGKNIEAEFKVEYADNA